VPTASLRGRFPSGADSAIINPKLSLLALLGTLQRPSRRQVSGYRD
jgi:hypothetical protein